MESDVWIRFTNERWIDSADIDASDKDRRRENEGDDVMTMAVIRATSTESVSVSAATGTVWTSSSREIATESATRARVAEVATVCHRREMNSNRSSSRR